MENNFPDQAFDIIFHKKFHCDRDLTAFNQEF